MTSERIRDRWEVQACETCGWERHVKVSYLYGPDNPSWDKTCDVCNARWRLRKIQQREAVAEHVLHTALTKRAKEVERRKKKPLNRAPREVLEHIRWESESDRDGLSTSWCKRRGNGLRFNDPDRANCEKCKKAHDAALEKEPDAAPDHLLP